MAVVLEHHELRMTEHAVGRIGGCQVDAVGLEGGIQQAEVHHDRLILDF